ncbi:hypothetical protein CPB83DRAFT_759631 [Crepidotus variabilis]|uniref:Amidohydrolase-related domain-containing protein n=1 Tax=Crepidotus variabilis TaxID=179855 RepID=A0A9P6ENQ0_9AGAR|nr:hypothetical protein CPB83DRAFT_759631 [Crepidotus variabilis]
MKTLLLLPTQTLPAIHPTTHPHLSLPPLPHPQPQPPTPPNQPRRTIYQLRAKYLFDSVSRVLVPNQVVTVDESSGVVLGVCEGGDEDEGEGWKKMLGLGEQTGDVKVEKIDLGDMVLLPGFVDVHVHFFLHPYSETSWDDQLLKESLAERTIRATNHARQTLLAGFTTVRDLGTEGAFDADIGLRKCLSGPNPIIPGPRYYCSTRAIISTGSYGPQSALYPSQNGVDGVMGAQPVDGVDECVKEVRKQIGAGADWIKIYADYRIRARQSDVSSTLSTKSISTFTPTELAALVNTAHSRGVKVAAHANSAPAISHLLDAHVDSIEHGSGLFDASTCDKSLIRKFLRNRERTTWVPTLSAYYTSWLNAGGSEAPSDSYASEAWRRCQEAFEEVVMRHAPMFDNIAVGGDTGVYEHGRNGLEMVLMRRYGAGWERVLGWGTLGGWKCVRGREETPFGAIRVGWAADLVGIQGKLDGSADEFEQAVMEGVSFVMKGGRIYKRDGRQVV